MRKTSLGGRNAPGNSQLSNIEIDLNVWGAYLSVI